MDKELEERIQGDVELEHKLEVELSEAIAGVLKNYGVEGTYVYNVRRQSGDGPDETLNGRKLVTPVFCFAAGYAHTDNPKYIRPR